MFKFKITGSSAFKRVAEFLSGIPGDCYMFITPDIIQIEKFYHDVSAVICMPRRSFRMYRISTEDKIYLKISIQEISNILKEFRKGVTIVLEKEEDSNIILIYPEDISNVTVYSVDYSTEDVVEIPPEIYRVRDDEYVNTLSVKEFCSIIKSSSHVKKDSLILDIYTNGSIGIYKTYMRSTSETVLGDNIGGKYVVKSSFNISSIVSKSMCKLQTLVSEGNIIIYSNTGQILFVFCVGDLGLLYIILPASEQ